MQYFYYLPPAKFNSSKENAISANKFKFYIKQIINP